MKLWATFQLLPFYHLSVSQFPCGKMVLLLLLHGAIWESSGVLSRSRERDLGTSGLPGCQRLLSVPSAQLTQWIFHDNALSLSVVPQFACL